MLKYKEYKSSSSAFDRKIPKHWDEYKISWLFDFRNDKKHVEEELLSVYLDRGVVSYSSTSQKQVHKPSEDLSNYQLVMPGDFVLNNQQAWRGSVGVSKYRGIISPAYYVLKPRIDINHYFLNYAGRDKAVVDQFVIASKGVGSIQRQIYIPYLKNVVIQVPPKEEQDQIVRYLDWKVSEMNHFIHEKKKQIRHLEELRKVKISQIATRGIHEDVEMKESGLDWLGDIPKHWSVTRVRNNYTLQNGISESGAFFDKGSPFVNYSDVYKNRILPTEFTDVANSSKQQQETFSVRKGDIFFTRTSETIDEIGIASICLHDVSKAVFSGFLIRARAKSEQLDPEYVGLYLQSQCVRNYFTKEMNLVIRASLGQNLLKSLYIPIPPKDEQREIVEYLYKVLDDFDCMISNIRKEISLVEELRVKTIADVVTGQIDVRNVIIPEYTVDEADEDFDSDDVDDGSEESDEDEE